MSPDSPSPVKRCGAVSERAIYQCGSAAAMEHHPDEKRRVHSPIGGFPPPLLPLPHNRRVPLAVGVGWHWRSLGTASDSARPEPETVTAAQCDPPLRFEDFASQLNHEAVAWDRQC